MATATPSSSNRAKWRMKRTRRPVRSSRSRRKSRFPVLSRLQLNGRWRRRQSRPAATTPTARPAATPPTARPAATTPTARPAATTPTARPAATTPTARPAATTPTARPAATTPTARPAATPPTARPAATTPTARPAATTPTARPAATPPTARPAATTPTARPAATPQNHPPRALTQLLPTLSMEPLWRRKAEPSLSLSVTQPEKSSLCSRRLSAITASRLTPGTHCAAASLSRCRCEPPSPSHSRPDAAPRAPGRSHRLRPPQRPADRPRRACRHCRPAAPELDSWRVGQARISTTLARIHACGRLVADDDGRRVGAGDEGVASGARVAVMSGQRVDVLAVLDHIADCDHIPLSTADLNATRAAVAELADSAKRMLRY